MPDQKPTTWNISTLAIVKIILTLLILYFAYLMWDILVLIIMAIILAVLIDPLADRFEKRKVPRTLAVLLVYIILISLIGLIVVLIVPPITTQFQQLTDNIPNYWDRLKALGAEDLLAKYDLSALQNSFKAIETSLTEGIFTGLGGIFGGVVSFFLVLVLTFYMVVEEKELKNVVRSLVPAHYQPYLSQLAGRMKEKMAAWLKGQLILCLIIGLAVFTGLSILGVKYALVLGLIAGFLEIIPYVGPWVAAALAIFIALGQSPMLALFTLILFVVVQWLENNLLVPKILQKAVGLNPIISILAIITGAKLAGFLGVLFAIPVASALSILLQDFFRNGGKPNV
ncbi:AI-2E family transporter [Candidatus Falkowbacteria bacterium]|nr:AI-2E family transporter [Candidatus Falkowbacteria bacterium]